MRGLQDRLVPDIIVWEDAHIIDPEPLSIMGKIKKVNQVILRVQLELDNFASVFERLHYIFSWKDHTVTMLFLFVLVIAVTALCIVLKILTATVAFIGVDNLLFVAGCTVLLPPAISPMRPFWKLVDWLAIWAKYKPDSLLKPGVPGPIGCSPTPPSCVSAHSIARSRTFSTPGMSTLTGGSALLHQLLPSRARQGRWLGPAGRRARIRGHGRRRHTANRSRAAAGGGDEGRERRELRKQAVKCVVSGA